MQCLGSTTTGWQRLPANRKTLAREQREITNCKYIMTCQQFFLPFFADRTNGRAIGTVLRLSVCRLFVVCDVMYCG